MTAVFLVAVVGFWIQRPVIRSGKRVGKVIAGNGNDILSR